MTLTGALATAAWLSVLYRRAARHDPLSDRTQMLSVKVGRAMDAAQRLKDALR